MASSKSTAIVRRSSGLKVKAFAKSNLATGLYEGPERASPNGTIGFQFNVSDNAARALTSIPKPLKKTLLEFYGDAIFRSRMAGRRVSFRIDVDPAGETVVTPFEEAIAAPEPVDEKAIALHPELEAALAAARERGRLHAAKILARNDMLSADAFAKMLGTTRVTVNAKRQSGQVLGLDGAKRGFRFPDWQLDAEGKPYAGLAALHERLGGPWAVYRFLVQSHGELGGLTGREALERGRLKAVLEAAESVGRDFS